MIYREPELARAVHTQDASYLDVIHVSDGEWNPTDYAYHLTRRARGLPLWFSLAVYGVEAYRDAIEAAVWLARETADLVKQAPHLELIREPDLGVVLFRRRGMAGRGLRPLGRAAARRGRRVHPAEQVGRRDGRPVRVPAPRHQHGPRARGPGPDRVGERRWPTCSRCSPRGSTLAEDGTVIVGGCRADDLAEEFGTPVLVVAEQALRARAREYADELSTRWPNSRVVFASKAFPCTAVQRVMVEEGLGLDVAGGGEILTALKAGVDPALVVLHGNAKSDEEIAMAVDHGIGLVVVDNSDDVDRLEATVPSREASRTSSCGSSRASPPTPTRTC